MRVALRVVSISTTAALTVVLVTILIGASASASPSGCSYPVSRPPDRPIGVALQTLSADRCAAIWIDDKPVRDTSDRDGIFVDVLSRSDRSQLEPGTVPRNGPGIEHLSRIADQWKQRSPREGYLMIVSGPIGVHQTDVDALNRLIESIGGTKLTTAQRNRLIGGAPWSVIGIPGGPPDSAWVRIGVNNGSPGSGDIAGYLQKSVVTGEYDYVSPDYPTFDTRDGGEAGRNFIRVGDTKYLSAALPRDALGGFQIVAVNPQTLRLDENVTVTTNTPGDVSHLQSALARQFKHVEYEIHPAPLVFIQSVGHPRAERRGWSEAADAIEAMGGTRLVFAAVDGERKYSLVGGSPYKATAVELSDPDPKKEDRLVGVLARGHDMSFTPTEAGPLGGVNAQLVSMAYQAAKPFPALSTPAQQAAERYIGEQSGVCSEDEPCDFRRAYYAELHSTLSNLDSKVARITWPGPDGGMGATSAVFDAVKQQLLTELGAVVNVGNYFAELQTVFGKAGQPGRVDLNDIGSKIFDELGSKENEANASALEFVSKIASLAGAIPPPGGNVGKAASTLLAIQAYMTRHNGTALLAQSFKVKADRLASDFQRRMGDAEDRLTDVENLFLSDYGKLVQFNARIKTLGWKLEKESRLLLVGGIARAARQWFAQELAPLAFWAVRGTPFFNANGLSCGVDEGDEGGAHTVQRQPWSDEPADAQVSAVVSWEHSGRAIVAPYFLSKIGRLKWPNSNLAPSRQVTELLFGNATAKGDTGPLELDKLTFLSPKVFGTVKRANNRAFFCDI